MNGGDVDETLPLDLGPGNPFPGPPAPEPESTHVEDLKERRKLCTTTDGKPPDPELLYASAPKPINPATGQHEAYWVLAPEERAKGFIRPVRRTYLHVECGSTTMMGTALAETWARDVKFYGSTFCCSCKGHFPVGEFRWDGTDEVVGS